jgi:Flp pilus assembly protein TadD
MRVDERPGFPRACGLGVHHRNAEGARRRISNLRLEISNFKSEASNLKSEISNFKFQISNFKFQISTPLCSLCLCVLRVKSLLRPRPALSVTGVVVLLFASAVGVSAQKSTRPRPPAASQASARTLAVSTQPNAVVWVDEVRRGVTDAEGKLGLALSPGRHTLRVRALGFAERTLALTPAQRGALQVRLTPTADEAELLFQQAEEAREKAGGAQQSIDLYRRALKLRPRFPAARVGLARALASLDDYDSALAEITAARRERPNYAEASAAEGRIHRSLAQYEDALDSYRRALREARGFQPEAHTGVGLVLEEQSRHEEAVAAFRRAISQLSDTEPVLYELLGRNLERLERWKEAADAYDKYLALAPEGSNATAVRSIVEQLRRQAAEQERQK